MGKLTQSTPEIQRILNEADGIREFVAETVGNISVNAEPMVSVTYDELVNLRNNGELIAGMQYRIIDYVTTTVQEYTQSAGHQFDIIVTADNENTLNEVARACRPEIDIEKYKDAECYTIGVKMLYVSTYKYNGNEYHLYETETHSYQMLMDFNNPNILADFANEYPYGFYPLYIRSKKDGVWGDWINGNEEGETISFKYNLAEDTYFYGSNLAAWQIWYSLDNDTKRFAWAADIKAIKIYDSIDESSLVYKRDKEHDTNLFAWAKVVNSDDTDLGYISDWEVDHSDLVFTESEDIALGSMLIRQGDISVEVVDKLYGKGVIYRMIDEFGNDCPYDFKNIMFRRYEAEAPEESEDSHYLWILSNNIIYQLDNGSISYRWCGCDNDDIYWEANDELISSNTGDYRAFYTFSNFIDDYEEDVYLITDDSLNKHCRNNIIKEAHSYSGVNVLNNIVLLSECSCNTFGLDCNNITIGNECKYNSFKSNCQLIIFGNRCYYNELGESCSYFTYGNDCKSNINGNESLGITLGNYCLNNTICDSTANIAFDNYGKLNTIGKRASYSAFSSSFANNIIGEDCFEIEFISPYCQYNCVDSGVSSITVSGYETASSAQQVQNYHLTSGIKNQTISAKRKREYKTTVAFTSNNLLMTFNLADLA